MARITFNRTGYLRLPDGSHMEVAAGRAYEFDDLTAAWVRRNWPDWLEPDKPRPPRRTRRKPKRAAFDSPPVEK